MGSSIYQVGIQPSWLGYGAESEMGELPVLAEAWNEARTLALSRLAQEATRAGASAVVGVDVRTGSGGIAAASGTQSIEYTAVGTAVQRASAPSGPPIITDLSIADYLKLIEAGIEPVGVVAWTSVFFVSPLYIRSEQEMPIIGSSWRNFELKGVTQCFYSAREQVVGQMGAQAERLGASGIVGVRIGHRAVPHAIGGGAGYGQQERTIIMVTMSAIGTAILGEADAASELATPDSSADHYLPEGVGRRGGARLPSPKLKIDLLS